jgi:hypothetical protein
MRKALLLLLCLTACGRTPTAPALCATHATFLTTDSVVVSTVTILTPCLDA